MLVVLLTEQSEYIFFSVGEVADSAVWIHWQTMSMVLLAKQSGYMTSVCW